MQIRELVRYPRNLLRRDIVAGLATAAVVVPESMAYATLAGLPVEFGLYTALVPLVLYVFLGSARVLVVSTTSTLSILTAAELSKAGGLGGVDPVAVAAALSLTVGGVLLLSGVLRLGFIANLLSASVVIGFKTGVGLVILVGQLGKVLGIEAGHGSFFERVRGLIAGLPDTHGATLAVGLPTLVILFGLPRIAPRVPAALVAVAVGIGASAFLDLESAGVALIGPIRAGLPAVAWPRLDLVPVLLPGALGLALMCFTETSAVGRAFARHDDPRILPNRELLAVGAANLIGSLFRCFPAGGGTSQTAVASGAGARSQLTGLVLAASVATVLLVVGPLIALMPLATLGAIVIWVAVHLIRSAKEIRSIARIRRMEATWAVAATLGVVALGTLHGILVAVAISVLSLMWHANRPPLYALARKKGTDIFRPEGDHPEDETFPGLLIIRTEGRMHFASAPQLADRLISMVQSRQPQVLLLDCSAIPDFEYTALNGLARMEEKLREAGASLWLAALNPEALRVIRRTPLASVLGNERMFHNLESAVEAYMSAADRWRGRTGEAPAGSGDRVS